MRNKFFFQTLIIIVLFFSPLGSIHHVSAFAETSYVSTNINPANVQTGESAVVTVSLHNVPPEGYKSAEFICSFNPAFLEASNIIDAGLFGTDSVTVVNGPQNGSLIVAIAGSNENKATTSGAAFNFNVKALMPSQAAVDCTARISTGGDDLAPIPSIGSVLNVTALAPPTPTPEWQTYSNFKYGFGFKYPPQGQIIGASNDTYARFSLPFVLGTNLSEKYLEVIVNESISLCQSPLATSSILESSESLNINGISFLKQMGGDNAAGNLYRWTAYSTIQNNACVSLNFILKSANPGVFTSPPPLFDEAAESAIFGLIVSSYTQWLVLPPATPTFIPTSTVISNPNAFLSGQVIASKTVTVRLYNVDQSLAASVNANPDGSFSFELAPGSYTIVATANGFLRAQGSITLAAGENRFMPTLNLLPGDIDDDGFIDHFDAMTIGFSYGTSQLPGADLNSDGIINALDLELLAQNFRKTGPVIWQ